jgi:hypothetical protein
MRVKGRVDVEWNVLFFAAAAPRRAGMHAGCGNQGIPIQPARGFKGQDWIDGSCMARPRPRPGRIARGRKQSRGEVRSGRRRKEEEPPWTLEQQQ